MGIRPVGVVVGGAAGGLIGVRETLFVAAVGGLYGVVFLFRSPVLALQEIPETAEV